MYKINFKNPIHIHFIGIGGISMSGLAQILHKQGFKVSGSDEKVSSITEYLTKMGINVIYGQRASNITSDIDLVVYTAAIKEDNSEFQATIKANIPMLDRASLLGQIMKNYDNAIAVAGTHGKTTTTSMISHILLAADLDPTISVGGMLKAIGGNIRIGHSKNFITEACEYTNSFLKFYPTISIILNVEEDHLDFFKDLEDIRNSFKQFAHKLPEKDGLLIINKNIENYEYLIDDLKCNIITYGISDDNNNDFNYTARNISFDEFGKGSYDLIKNNEFITRINLNVVGIHNISNSIAAIATALYLNIPINIIKSGLESFYGTDRRFEHKGNIAGITIIDDYAHHPTEIKATLTSAKNYPHQKIWCVFQPHTYTRTKLFLKDFANVLSMADYVVLADIYAAREKNTGEISSKDLMAELQKLGTNVSYFPSFDEIEQFLLQNCSNGDLLITMGAGDIVKVGEDLLGI